MIKIIGKLEHPRYMQRTHPLTLFNPYLEHPYYRLAILIVINGISSYRDLLETEFILKTALDEAAIWESAPENQEELDRFMELVRTFVNQRKYFESYRGIICEQAMKILGPPVECDNAYDPSKNCVEEAQIYSEMHGYENGGGTKDVDLAFHNGKKYGNSTVHTDKVVACEVKCNINTFIENIIRSQVPNNSKNYEKLMYLNGMKAALKDYASVFVLTLSEPRAASKRFLSEYSLNHIMIWSPL